MIRIWIYQCQRQKSEKIKRHFVGVWATCRVRVVISGLNKNGAENWKKKMKRFRDHVRECRTVAPTWLTTHMTHLEPVDQSARPDHAPFKWNKWTKKKVMSAHFFLEFVTRTSIWSRLLILFSPNQSVRWKKERAKTKNQSDFFCFGARTTKTGNDEKRDHRFSIILWRIK